MAIDIIDYAEVNLEILHIIEILYIRVLGGAIAYFSPKMIF